MFKIVQMSHILIKEFLKAHQNKELTLIDATSGMGNDSLFIAQNLNNQSRLYCYDIQSEAIVTTNQLLLKNNIQRQYVALSSPLRKICALSRTFSMVR